MYWEPWKPEVGQRVRILARPECRYCEGEEGVAEVGVTGVVSEVTPPEGLGIVIGDAGHCYWVDFDDPEVGCGLSHFAAIELEPIP